MWKSVLVGIVLENIETLKHYQALKGETGDTVESITQYISTIVKNLPWYFYLPVRIFVSIIALLCLTATGHKLNTLSSEKRSSFLRRIRFIPFFDMLNKLVRSMAFLKLFDIFPLSPEYVNCVNTDLI